MAQGAGRKPQDNHEIDGELSRKQVLIDDENIKTLLAIGDGELSLGIREAARRLREMKKVEAYSATRIKG